MISNDKLKDFLDYLNKNGLYQIEDNKELLQIYPKIIQYYTTKVKSNFVSNILQIKSLSKNKDLKNRFVADCKFSKSIKRSYLELKDKKILALLKDYEFMLKGSLKCVEEIYKELKKSKITDEDCLGIDKENLKEMYEYLKNNDNSNYEDKVNKTKSKRSKQEKDLPKQNDSIKINEESFKECLDEIMASATPITSKKINFANLLIYSRFN